MSMMVIIGAAVGGAAGLATAVTAYIIVKRKRAAAGGRVLPMAASDSQLDSMASIESPGYAEAPRRHLTAAEAAQVTFSPVQRFE